MNTIMVQMSDEQWTLEAMHFACAIARRLNGKVVLLHLMNSSNPGLLGWAGVPTAMTEQHLVERYSTIAEDYGVEFHVQPMQFVTLTDALVQAVERLQASFLFANIPMYRFAFWRQFRLWSLKHHLNGCCLYTLHEEQPVYVETIEESVEFPMALEEELIHS